MRKMRSRVASLSAAIAAVVCGGLGAQAQSRDLTWDLDNGSATASGNSTSGDWGAGIANWVDAGGNRVTWSSSPADSAFFGGTNTAWVGGPQNSINLAGNVSAQNITLGVGSNGVSYHIVSFGEWGGGNLTLGGNITKTAGNGELQILFDSYTGVFLTPGNHVVAMNDSPGDVAELAMNATLYGSGDLTVDNGGYAAWGTMEMNYDSRDYTGRININKGRIAITTKDALGSTSAGTTISGLGTLSFGGAGGVVNSLTINEPITIRRNTYGGSDPEAGRYPAAVISMNGTGTNTLAGPLIIDSTDARIRANSSTLVVSSVVTTGTNAGSILTIDGDTAGFVRLTANNSGANSLSQNGIRVVGGELLLDNDNQYGGTAAPLRFSGGYVRFNNGYHTSFAGMNVNFDTFSGGLDIREGETFTINENLAGGSLSMRGTGTLNINGTNALTAASFYDGGVINVNASHAIGGLRMRNATMNVNEGATLSTVNAYSSVGLDPGESATLNLKANAKLIAANADFNVADNGNATTGIGSKGTFNLAAGSSATIGGSFEIGKNPNAVGVVNATGATISVGGETWVGNNLGTGTFKQSGGTTTANNWFVVGRDRSTGTVELSNGAMLIKKGGGNTEIDAGGVAGSPTPSVMTLKGGSTFDIQTGELRVGTGGNSNGTLNITENSTVNVNNWIGLGRDNGTGVINLVSGSLNKAGANNISIGWQPSSNGKLVQTGGAFNVTAGETWIGEGGVALYDISAGTGNIGVLHVGHAGGNTADLRVSGSGALKATDVVLAAGGSVTGTVNLLGGSLTANSVSGGGGTGTKTLNFNGGTLKAGLDGADLVRNLTAANVQAGGAVIDSNGVSVSLSQTLQGGAGDGGLTKVGNGVLALTAANQAYTGATTVNGGTLRVTGSVLTSSGVTANAGGTFEAGATQRVKALTTAAGGAAVVTAAAGGPKSVLFVGEGQSATPSLNVGGGSSYGKVDVGSNGLVVDVAAGGEAAALASVRDAIRPAYNNGAWDGNGLTSSSVTAANRLAVGYAAVKDVPTAAPGNLFLGAAVDASAVVVRATIAGDSNLDSTVNFTDLLSLAKSYNQSGKVWQDGDFTYDGTVNFTDLLTLAKNYNQAMPSEPVPGATAEFQADLAAAFAAVPEPGGLAVLGLGAGALLGRRRRQRAAGRAK